MKNFLKSHVLFPLVLLFAAFVAIFVPFTVLEGLVKGVDEFKEGLRGIIA